MPAMMHAALFVDLVWLLVGSAHAPDAAGQPVIQKEQQRRQQHRQADHQQRLLRRAHRRSAPSDRAKDDQQEAELAGLRQTQGEQEPVLAPQARQNGHAEQDCRLDQNHRQRQRR